MFKRVISTVVLAVCLGAPVFAADLPKLQELASTGETVAGVMERVRELRDRHHANVIAVDWEDFAFLIPAAGSVQGNNGTFFRSDVTIANRRSAEQIISVLWIARGVNNGNASAQSFTIPANTTIIERDFVGNRLGKSGLGAILIVGRTSGGAIDENAELDGFSRIWTPQPNSTGTVSQEFTSVELEDSLATSFGYGLRQDTQYRTNLGFVNIWDTPNTYTVNIVGTGGNTSLTQLVQPFSMEQVPAPAGNWGDFYIRVSSASSNFNWWTAYAASTDNITGDGWVSHVH
ncbi:MAG: hypothetical protein QOH21_723 [Acidobacteriota bacterium]|jgi:hypothetical protein|nr:hypothetical protein [Acidobacteriota bacterium]